MADAGGHGVDEYLEANFQLPEEVSTFCHTIKALCSDGFSHQNWLIFILDRSWL